MKLNTHDLAALKGTPLPQDASFDEFRLKDVPGGVEVKAGQRLDPLLQVMSEEQASGFATETAGAGTQRITNPGRDPWQVKKLRGKVSFKRPDANQLKVTALDFNGRPAEEVGVATRIQLQPTTIYYLIHR